MWLDFARVFLRADFFTQIQKCLGQDCHAAYKGIVVVVKVIIMGFYPHGVTSRRIKQPWGTLYCQVTHKPYFIYSYSKFI